MELHVDLVALQDIGEEVQHLIRLLNDGTCFGPSDAGGLGGSDVADAVDRFRAGWLADRQRTTEQLQVCLALVELAVEQYTQTECRLQDAAGAVPGVRP